MNDFLENTVAAAVVALGISTIIALPMWIYPSYNVWSSRKSGEAELAQAQYTKQIAISEALAKEDAAADLAKAEVIRAGGVAKANKIIGQSLNNNEAYLRYLWINNIQDTKNQIIYVPTETNLPILEASRLKEK